MGRVPCLAMGIKYFCHCHFPTSDLLVVVSKLEPGFHIHRQITMELSNRSGVDVRPGVKLVDVK